MPSGNIVTKGLAALAKLITRGFAAIKAVGGVRPVFTPALVRRRRRRRRELEEIIREQTFEVIVTRMVSWEQVAEIGFSTRSVAHRNISAVES